MLSGSAVLGPRSGGAMGSRGPLPPKLRAQACLASVRPVQRPPRPETLTGPSHGAPWAPPARPGAAATAAAAIPGPGAAPHPAPPQPGARRWRQVRSAPVADRWRHDPGPRATPRSPWEGRETALSPSPLGPSAPVVGKRSPPHGKQGHVKKVGASLTL